MRDDTIPSFRKSFFALSLTLEKVLLETNEDYQIPTLFRSVLANSQGLMANSPNIPTSWRKSGIRKWDVKAFLRVLARELVLYDVDTLRN